MATSSTTFTTISSTTASSSSKPTSTKGADSPCPWEAFNTAGLNGRVCRSALEPEYLNITACTQQPSEIRQCGDYYQVFESKFQGDNSSMVLEQTSDCIKDLIANSGWVNYSLSVSCRKYQDGVQVSGANSRMGNGIYDGAMGIWALVMVLGWALKMI